MAKQKLFKKVSVFQGRTADKKVVRVVAPVDPNNFHVRVAVQGFGVRDWPKSKLESLMAMGNINAEPFFNSLHN